MSRSELNAKGADGVWSEANRVIAKQADTRTSTQNHVDRLKLCITQFREVVDYSVDEGANSNAYFASTLWKIVNDNKHFVNSKQQEERLKHTLRPSE